MSSNMVSIIAAVGRNRELGRDNKLLWHIPEDMKRFKDLTTGHAVIMGRKTYESLPKRFRPLPKRKNIVVTRDLGYKAEGAIVVHSIQEAVEEGKKTNKEAFIVGGAQIYKLGMKFTQKLYLTLIDREYPDADAFFPDYSQFGKLIFEQKGRSGELQYKFIELVR